MIIRTETNGNHPSERNGLAIEDFGTWNCRLGGVTGSMVRTFRDNYTIYQNCGNTRELGTAFIVMGDMQRREYDRCPNHDVKISMGDLNAQVGQEEEYIPSIGKFNVHQLTN